MEDLVKQAARDLMESKYAIALTGAGMSTESGIPDFRGPKGIWTTNKEAEAKAYQRYELFLNNPNAYWEEMLGITGPMGRSMNKSGKPSQTRDIMLWQNLRLWG
jgi:NAD-dependent SIR2 family protein deacetylase